MELGAVMNQLEDLGAEQTRKIYRNHGAEAPMFGVKVGDLKKILKKTKKNHQLALELYETGNLDAMYLAGLMADAKKVTKEQLQAWVQKAHWYMISEYAVAGLAAESAHGWELGRQWIESEDDHVSTAGWATLSGVLSIQADENLNLEEIEALLARVQAEIHQAPNRTRYSMNGFVIAVGAYVTPLTRKAFDVAKTIGKVSVEMGKTSCKVPIASDYIEKMAAANRIGKKRKQVRC